MKKFYLDILRHLYL